MTQARMPEVPEVDGAFTLDVLRRLIAINSVNPSLVPGAPGEQEIAMYLAGVCREIGCEVATQEAAPGRPNVIATLRGTGGGRSLMLNGHVDTVSVAGMDRPLDPRQVGGRIVGRGAVDMKASLAAMVGAAAALHDAPRPAGDLVLAFVVDEEYASLGSEALVRAVRTDAAVVTEPTGLDVCVAHKGFAWVTIETAGRAAHGSRYDEGRDAITAMGRVLTELARLDAHHLPRRHHPLLGRPSVHASLIEGGEGLSTYPGRCRLQVERRTLPGETAEDIRSEMDAVLARASAGDPAFTGTSEVFFFRPAYEIAADAPIVAVLRDAATRARAAAARIVGQWPWMDSAILGGAGIPTVIFGPTGGGAHAAEEYVEADSVVQCARVLAATARAFCGGT